MWLRDWLQTEKDLNARIMAFNHNTSWNAYALDKSLHDHGDDLLRALETVRQDEVKQTAWGVIAIELMDAEATQAMHRPIIFIGHCFGGLIIKQVGPERPNHIRVSPTSLGVGKCRRRLHRGLLPQYSPKSMWLYFPRNTAQRRSHHACRGDSLSFPFLGRFKHQSA